MQKKSVAFRCLIFMICENLRESLSNLCSPRTKVGVRSTWGIPLMGVRVRFLRNYLGIIRLPPQMETFWPANSETLPS